MYITKVFEITERSLLSNFIRQNPLATVCVHQADGLAADHLPLLLRSANLEVDGDWGDLVGHIARANSLSKKAANGIDCLAIFQGIEGYISPNYYATKQSHGKVVPTWNYQAVHCYGRIQVITDTLWIAELVNELTNTHEQTQSVPWKVSDAPQDYLNKKLESIVGISIKIDRVEAKFKMSQNQPRENIESLTFALAQGDVDSRRLGEAIRVSNP